MKTHLNELISGYVDEQLSAQELARVEEHVKGCAQCRAEVDAMRSLKTAVAAAGTVPMELSADFFWSQVRRQLNEEPAAQSAAQSAERREIFPWHRFRWLTLGATAALLMAIGFRLVVMQNNMPRGKAPAFVQVDDVKATAPNTSVTAFHSSVANVAVIWISGVETIEQPDEL